MKPCSAGTHGTLEGAATETAGCDDCSAGYYCPGGPATPMPCPAGAYCGGGSATPTLCSAGTYNKFQTKSSSGDCLSCQGGEYCPEGSIAPLDCPSGSHCDGTSGTVLDCPAGFYMPLNSIPDGRVTTSADCLTCPLGHYCEAGSSSPTPCPVGTYRDATGGDALTDCANCTEGKACPFIAITDINSAVACAYGHYCPEKTEYPYDNPCPAGKFSDSTSLTASSNCSDCPAGYGCSAGANSYNNPPVECAAGYYCPSGSATSSHTQCPAGTYSSNTGLTVSTECTQCPAGQYCEIGSVSPTGLCPAGFWCPTGTSSNTSYPCPTGTYSDSTGLKTQNECTVCPLGYICDSTNMTAPIKCPAGTYGSKSGLTGDTGSTCTTCPAGYFCAEGVSEPTPCGKGKYSVAGAKDTGTPVCTKCPAGSYCALEATADTDVKPCAAGFICNIETGDTGVAEVPYHPAYSCPAGEYCAQGVTEGTECPKGTYNPTSGKTSSLDCLTVPAGYYADTTGTVSITSNECPAGYYCLLGADSSTSNPCSEGTYRSLKGAKSSEDCAVCPTGYYCGENTVTPAICPRGYYCTNGISEPIKCPKGYYGANTGLKAEVDCTICPQGRYCSQAGLSAPDGLCDPSYYCGEGSTSPAPPTTRRRLNDVSDSGICPAGGYCEQGSKYPTRCPPGNFSTLEGQDEASDCNQCTDGHYCIGTIEPNTSGQCSAGYYCNGGSTIPTQYVADQGYYATVGSATQTACPNGTYNPFFAQSSCTPCKAGYYCQNTGMKNMTECPTGKYCPAGSDTNYNCPAGTYNDRKRATSASDCKACPPGKFCGVGVSTPSGDCAIGHYCRTSATTATPTGSGTNFGDCPAGYYCPEGTGDPYQCPPGTFQPDIGKNSPTDCQTCTQGYYCSKPNLAAVEGKCPVGYYCPAGTDVKYPTTFCVAGEYCPEGSFSASTCDGGTYQNAPRQGYCRECPAGYTCGAGATAFAASPCSMGKYCPEGSSTETNCPAGTYNPMTKKTDLADCIKCDPGSYCASAGASAVTGSCTAGYYCTLESTTPTPASGVGGPCTQGYYCPAGATVALPCPPKKYCAGSQLSAPSGDCKEGYYCIGKAIKEDPTNEATEGGDVCPAGHYCLAGTSSPNPCSPGTYRASTGGTSSGSCTTCPGGSYCSSFGGTSITDDCEAGFYCPAGSSVANANICPAGNKCPEGAPAPTPCTDPEYQDQKGQEVCKTCSAGYWCTSTSRTLCRPDQTSLSFYCPANQYSKVDCSDGTITDVIGATAQSDCVNCPPGYYCPNDSTLSKTVECKSGFYCSGGAYKDDGTGTGTGPCPVAHYCPSGTNEPINCTPGKYCATTGLQTPTGDCDAGYYCLEGSDSATPSTTSMGGICPAGSYCPVGSSINIECPTGTYNPDTGKSASSDCLTCPAGKKCLGRGLITWSSNCPAGYYCTQNPFTLNPCEEGYKCPLGSDAMVLCPAGHYQAYTLQDSCDTCPEGYYCPQTDTTRKIICPAGSFCTSGQDSPTDCPTGTYNPREGAQKSGDCEQCPNGKYCGTTGLSTPGSDCTAGYYCTRGASSATANSCPTGYYCPTGTKAPVPCPPGTYNDQSGKSLLTNCKACPAGKFCPTSAMTSAPTGNNCAEGFICLGGSRTKYPLDGTTGRLCNPGYYCQEGTTSDTLCPHGTYNPYEGMSSCINCPNGYYCDNTMDTTTFVACPPGYYCPEGTAGTINMVGCPAGTYSEKQKLSTADECTPCTPGKYCLGGSTAVSGNCDAGYVCPRGATTATPSGSFSFTYGDANFNKPAKCPEGHRCPIGSYYPIPCADGTYQDEEGQSTCKTCPAGKYCDKTAINAAEIATRKCAAGHFCSGGTKVEKPIKTSHSGSICSSGKYCPAGTPSELDCPGGTYDKRKGSPACMGCPAGYYCPEGSREPTICPSTMYCEANSSAGTYCPDGTYNTEDGLESSDQCRPCPVSKYCTNGAVQGTCQSGYFCSSGAKAVDDSTMICPKNHYCEAGTSAPVRCEAGKVNNETGGTSPADCTTCPAGSYCPEIVPSTNTVGEIIDCPKGFYCISGVTKPTACPVGTFRDEVNATQESDCSTCNAGYLCNVEGIGDPDDFSCPVGYYCEAGVKNPTKCPAGTFRNTVGAGSATDCVECTAGFYCPEGSVNPIICPGKTYCPAGSNETTPCTAGKYCPPQTETPKDCPAAYYCPEGVETYIKCVNGTYCPENSVEPTLCDNGTFGNGNPNNVDFESSCVQCDAGTYSTTDMPGYCLPCTAGYVCLGQTITATPVDKTDDNGYECPVGYYCPEGSTEEIACPIGTYTDNKRTTSLSGCKACAANTYNNKEGQKGCKQCSGTAFSQIGATKCTCIGIGREYVEGTGECLCAKGYAPADGSANFNSDQNCELETTIECQDGYVASIDKKKCYTEEEYCKLECKNQGDGTGNYIKSVGKCECNTFGDFDAGCEANSCKNNRILKYGSDGKCTVYQSDGTTQVGTSYDCSSITGVLANSYKCKRDDGECSGTPISFTGSTTSYNFNESPLLSTVLRNLGIKDTPKPKGRVLATTTTITNPTVCIVAGNMVEFSVDTSTKSYPVYMTDSLLNTNPDFDYSGFLNLASTIEGGTYTVTTYVNTFDTAGTYVFMNSLDNYQQTIIRVVAADATCSSTNSVSATTLNSLYELNLSTTKTTNDVDMTFFIRLVATKIGLLVLLVGFVTYMHSIDNKWSLCPCLRKKDDEEEEARKQEELKKKERAVQLKAEELKNIRDELANHVDALRKRIAELEEARLKKLSERQKAMQGASTNKLLNTLSILKKYVKKRAKMIRNETGFDFEKDKNNFLIQKRFADPKEKEEVNPWELKRRKDRGEEPDKYDLPEEIRNQIDEEVENKEFQRLDKAQEDNRQQVSNYYDEERKKLEDRLRREGKLSENEIENILNDYDLHTNDMKMMLQDDERRQKENFKRQLDARKKRRKHIYGDIDKLRDDLKKAQEIEAKELEEHYKKMKEEENYVIGKVLVEEETKERKKVEDDIEAKKKAKLKAFENKLKGAKDKDHFKDLLDEYSTKEKEVEEELYNERKRAMMQIEAKMAERRRKEKMRIDMMKPEKSSVDLKGLEEKLQKKMDLLKKETDDEAAEMLEEERRKRKIQAELSVLRKKNDEHIQHLRDVNEERYEEFCKELNEKYDENQVGELIDMEDGSEGLQGMREELADKVSALKRAKHPEEKKSLEQRIEELKKDIAEAVKDGKEEEKLKRNNKILQERAKLVEEREAKKREFRWKLFEEEEKERDRLRDEERDEWVRKEKEAIDAVVDKFMANGDMEGLAEVLDQVYGAGSKVYSERMLALANKLQEKKARRLKYNFNANLDKKINDIKELNTQMDPLINRLVAKRNLIPEDDYKAQMKDLMMKENEKRAEIEALAANREQDSQTHTMIKFVEEQKDMVDGLNEDMKELRDYAFRPNKIKDKKLKAEMKKLNDKYKKELAKLKKEEEEAKNKEIEDINNRFKEGQAELEKNRKDFEMLSMFEKKMEDNRDSAEKFKKQKDRLLNEQLKKHKEALNRELTEDEKANLMAQFEMKMKNFNKALEKERERQTQTHSKQLKQKQRELEMKRRERELLLNSLSMYKDSRAQDIANEENFERLASMIEEDLELVDKEAYSYKPMKIYDLIKWKRETDKYLDALGDETTLLERVRRIEKYVANLNSSSYGRIKNLVDKVKKAS